MTEQVIDADRRDLHALVFGQSVAWATTWCKGPKVQGTPDELPAIERELDLLERGEKLPDTGGVLPA